VVNGEPRPVPVVSTQERMVVLRTFRDAKSVVALLTAGHPVLARQVLAAS